METIRDTDALHELRQLTLDHNDLLSSLQHQARGVRARSKSNNGTREVSCPFLFFFGFFYLYYKGWHKAAIVHALLCFCLIGTFWIAIPFYATKFVNFFEDL